MTENGNTEIF